jgi:enoyl-CoA hydratase/carnithine racemase
MTDPARTGPAGHSLVVDVDDAAGVAIIEIRRGPHNYFDVDLLTRVADAFDLLSAGPTRAVVLCSEGKNFCAGANLVDDAPAPDGAKAPHVYDAGIRLFEQPLPYVAAVQGAAVGGGLGLALSADFRVATPESRFAANFAQLGFHHGFGLTVTLPLVIGHQAALDLLYTGRRIDGTTAHRIGLCDELMAAEALRSRAIALAAAIASSAPLAVRSIRATMRGHLAKEVREAMAHERAEQQRLQSTDDFREGVTAMNERRTPTFVGR